MNEILTRTRGDITTEELLKIKEARIEELEDKLETPQVIFLKEQIAECNELMSKQSRDMELLQSKLDKAVEALELLTGCDCIPLMKNIKSRHHAKCRGCKNKQLIDNGEKK